MSSVDVLASSDQGEDGFITLIWGERTCFRSCRVMMINNPNKQEYTSSKCDRS
jgi:hypothetical protein